jgi:two-component system sensor histidine kinase FlrB
LAPSGKTHRVEIDPSLTKQALTNLIQNAVEANGAAPIEITLRVSEEDQKLKLTISNSGASIPPEICEQIFSPYFSTKSGGRNMGLGLTIVQKITIEQKGEVKCIPQDNGACFEITLPTIREESL